jgi:3-hydroxyisobutyrate dehydrogenase-like beta-hydroxyacid dehydrogenase
MEVGTVQVGFIGLGFLGGTLARGIFEGGFDTLLYDADPAVLKLFTAPNVTHASSVAEVASASDIVGVCVEGGAQVEDVVGGPNGLLSGAMPRGSIIVIHSACNPAICKRLEERAAVAGVSLIDAPITTNRDRSVRTVVVGGDRKAFERCLPVFESFADREQVLHLGVVGSGEVVKLLNNFLLVVNIGASAAALALGERLGVPRAVIESALTDGSGTSQGIKSLLTPRAGAANLLRLMTQDVAATVEMLESAGVEAADLARRAELGLAALRTRASTES